MTGMNFLSSHNTVFYSRVIRVDFLYQVFSSKTWINRKSFLEIIRKDRKILSKIFKILTLDLNPFHPTCNKIRVVWSFFPLHLRISRKKFWIETCLYKLFVDFRYDSGKQIKVTNLHCLNQLRFWKDRKF